MTSTSVNKDIEAGEELSRNKIYKKVIVRTASMPVPRPGKSLADLSSESPFYTIRLWLEERVGLPRLFDWLISMSAIVLGLSMFLYTSQMDTIIAGKFSDWYLPLKLALVISGFGLILSDMIQEEFAFYKNMSLIFKSIIFISTGAFSLFLLGSGDFDGFLMFGLFSLVIILESFTGMHSVTAFMLYIQGFVLGTALIFRYLPSDTGLSSLTAGIYSIIDGQKWILNLFVSTALVTTIFGYFFEKLVLKIALGISGILMTALSIYYANNNYWTAAFFLLITGIIGMLLPFWEKFRRVSEIDRTIVFRVFGSVIMAFSVVVIVIYIVQQILLANAKVNLADKANYGRITIDNITSNAIQSLSGLSQNDLFYKAMVSNNSGDLVSFQKAVFKNEVDLSSVLVLNKAGKVISAYPLSQDALNTNFSQTNYYGSTVISKRNYLSKSIDLFTNNTKSIIAGVPVFDKTNATVGAVVASLSLDSLSDRLQEIMVSDYGQYMSVVDTDGKWIVSPDQTRLGFLVEETDETNLLFTRDKGEGIGYDMNGKYALFVSEKSRISNWSVVVSQPISNILNIGRSGFVTIVFMLLVTVMSISFSFVFSRNKTFGV